MQAHYPQSIVSGGQTGADRGGLIAAAILGYLHGGYCTDDRKAEDGKIPDCYPMTPCGSSLYPDRTRMNVECSDATIVFTREEHASGGSALTLKLAKQYHRPAMHVWLEPDRPKESNARVAKVIRAWLAQVRPRDLNVAGQRESKAPGIQDQVAEVMLLALQSPSRCVCGREIPDSIWESARAQDKPLVCSQCGHTTWWNDFDPGDVSLEESVTPSVDPRG